jgi:hypothetical protein
MPAIVIKSKAERLAELGDIKGAAAEARAEIQQLRKELKSAIAEGKAVPENRVERLKQLESIQKDSKFKLEQQRAIDKAVTNRLQQARGLRTTTRDIGDVISLANGQSPLQGLKAIQEFSEDIGEQIGRNKGALSSLLRGVGRVASSAGAAYIYGSMAAEAAKAMGMGEKAANTLGWGVGGASAINALTGGKLAAGAQSLLGGVGISGLALAGGAALTAAALTPAELIMREANELGEGVKLSQKVFGKDTAASLERILVKKGKISPTDLEGYNALYSGVLTPYAKNMAMLEKMPPAIMAQLYNSYAIAKSMPFASDAGAVKNIMGDISQGIAPNLFAQNQVISNYTMIEEKQKAQKAIYDKDPMDRIRLKSLNTTLGAIEEDRLKAVGNYALL